MNVILPLNLEIPARVEAAQAHGVDMNAELEQALPAVIERSQFLRREAELQHPLPTCQQLHDALEAIAELGRGRPALPPEVFDLGSLTSCA